MSAQTKKRWNGILQIFRKTTTGMESINWRIIRISYYTEIMDMKKIDH